MMTTKRAGGVTRARRADQLEGGGAIPASALFVRFGETEAVKRLVLKYHYSGRWPSLVQLVASMHRSGGLFGDHGEAVAGAVFGLPPARWSEEVIELSRLVRADGVRVPLTLLLSLCLKRLRKMGWDLVVSFADRTEGHIGIVYQSSSWNFHAIRPPRRDGCHIDGAFWPARSLNSAFGTNSPTLLREMFPRKRIEPHYDAGKALYWRALRRSGQRKAARLGLESNPYPKPDAMHDAGERPEIASMNGRTTHRPDGTDGAHGHDGDQTAERR